MSNQANNFKNLVKGNPISQIIMALNMVSSNVVEELKQEYNAKNIDELAIKLS